MRELTSALFTMMWSGWVYGVKSAVTTLYPDDQLAATFDALFVVGDNIQRGIVDLVAGLVAPDGGSGVRACEPTPCTAAREEFC